MSPTTRPFRSRLGSLLRPVWPLLVGVLCWAIFTWPLPRHFATGIPSSDRNTEVGGAREMIPGDHLQLLYHFWLARDMLAGQTPPFANVYEFNTGGDEGTRRQPDPYYAPFSLVYALFSRCGGHAVGWNMAGLVAFLTGFLATFALARRYAVSLSTAMVATLVATAFPYRWITLLIGSPTGFAMGLVPLMLLGLDQAVRQGRFRGGLLAGVAIVCAYGSDLHVFYFSLLAAPAWCLFARLATPVAADALSRRRTLLRPILALLPAVILALAAAATSVILNRHLGTTEVAAGRSWQEVVNYSPHASGLLSYLNQGMSNHLFFGGALLLLLLLCGIHRAFHPQTGQEDAPARAGTLAWILGIALVLVVALALGANGPADGVLLRACRRLIPRYTMIRQTVKVYCLLPSLLAVLLALLMPRFRTSPGVASLAALLGVLVFEESLAHVRATICLLPPTQPAYTAAATHAQAAGRVPHALVLPLWPGDSHWTSIYQYGVMHSRLRMVNGYAPARRSDYVERVFHRFASCNEGVITDPQLDELAAMGVHYLVLHENAFPEQVSPFPAAITLRRLLQHPRLELLRQSGPVWCFLIREQPGEFGTTAAWGPPLFAAARRWEFERQMRTGMTLEAADGASASNALAGTVGGHALLTLRGPPAAAPDLRLAFRASGDGEVTWRTSGLATSETARVTTPGWLWFAMPVLPTGTTEPQAWTASISGGRVALDLALLTAGTAPATNTTGAFVFAAADLFHAGATDPRDGSVVLDPRRDPDGAIVYGPHLPVTPGLYDIRLVFETPAPAGQEVGQLAAGPLDGPFHVAAARAGEACWMRRVVLDNRPLRLEFRYHRTCAVRLRQFELRPAATTNAAVLP